VNTYIRICGFMKRLAVPQLLRAVLIRVEGDSDNLQTCLGRDPAAFPVIDIAGSAERRIGRRPKQTGEPACVPRLFVGARPKFRQVRGAPRVLSPSFRRRDAARHCARPKSAAARNDDGFFDRPFEEATCHPNGITPPPSNCS
jgi:hypothetical protein